MTKEEIQKEQSIAIAQYKKHCENVLLGKWAQCDCGMCGGIYDASK